MKTVGRDHISPALATQLGVKGGGGLALGDELLTTVQGMDLESSPNPPFYPWAVHVPWLGAVVGQYTYFEIRVRPEAPPLARLVIDELRTFTDTAGATQFYFGSIRGYSGQGGTKVDVIHTNFGKAYDPDSGIAQTELGDVHAQYYQSATDFANNPPYMRWPAFLNTWLLYPTQIVLAKNQGLIARIGANVGGAAYLRGRYFEQ